MWRFNQVRAITVLKARYFRLLDTKDWDRFAQLFTPDVEVDVTGEGMELLQGVDAFVATLQEQLAGAVTVHHGHMPEILLTSPLNHARGIWAMEDEIWWPEGSPVRHMEGAGHYHETYVRNAAGWRISSMRLTRL
ncbi:hypothetical protein B7486_60075 [cyanobacterium TDX16]|nr:hypothetical protein B7486_60075 [cyanobacterium TDX16]